MSSTLEDGIFLEHQILVRELIRQFLDSGLTIVRAAYQGYETPYKIGRYEPDIIAKDAIGHLVIGEAKRCDSIFSKESHEQFQDFSEKKQTVDGLPDEPSSDFHIIVPAMCEKQLGTILSQLGLITRTNIYCWTRD